MNNIGFPYRIFFLGDAAITVEYSNYIDESINREVMARFHELRQYPLPGMTDAVPAYSSITIHFDVMALKKMIPKLKPAFEWMKQLLEERLQQPLPQYSEEKNLVKIPVCFDEDFATDIEQLARAKKISVEKVIQIYTAKIYKVYMLGFLPGFPYMGEVDDLISFPRKPQPVQITEGSVGIAGKQTGIYPVSSPGGWNIIGRSPLKLFDAVKEDPAFLKAGDLVQFFTISKNEFENY
ncbi:MAG: 5-oxoprolinase subunit PxpB [Chitinophagaceae bacterium]